MDIRYKYHFSIMLQFNKDLDVDEIEKILNLKAYRKTSLADSKGPYKTAKIWFKTKDFDNVNTHEEIEKFLIKYQNNLKVLPKLFKEFDGEGGFDLIFVKTLERPIIELTTRAIEILNHAKLSFSVDFI